MTGSFRGCFACQHGHEIAVSSLRWKRMMTRRIHFMLLLMLLNQSARPNPRIGDAEWTMRFRRFMKELNEFIIQLNDNKIDEKKWKRVCESWSMIGAP
jgi:hypothetical protein